MKTIEQIRNISDIWDRAITSQDAIKQITNTEDELRAKRDAAALLLLQPWYRTTVQPTQARAAAKDAYYGYWALSSGEKIASTKHAADLYIRKYPSVEVVYHGPSISAAKYEERLAEVRKMRADAFAEVKADGATPLKPSQVQELLGIQHRNIITRILKRMSGKMPELANPKKAGQQARDALARHHAKYDEMIESLREIRDAAIEELIADLNVTNAEISRRLGMTNARVTQVRKGTR